MNRLRQSGFSLIELMIAILLASITAVVVLTVLSNYQKRSTSLIGRNDAQISAAVGLYSLEKEIRMAGAGLNVPEGQLCPLGLNAAYDGTVISDGAPLMPLRIIDGGAGPDSIEVFRSDSAFGAAPVRLVAAMASSIAQLSVDGRAGMNAGDLMLVGGPGGTKMCTLMGVTATTANGSGWLLGHAAGSTGTAMFNPADPSAAFTLPMVYDVRDMAINLGQFGVRRYGVLCTGGGVPQATNNCDLVWFNPLQFPAPGLADAVSITSQVVELQAQYGIAPAGATQVNDWVDATGTWAAPTLADQARIRAVRVSIVARANQDGANVAPAALTLWDDPGTTNDRVFALGTAERRFRYQVLTVVVPLINTIWAGP